MGVLRMIGLIFKDHFFVAILHIYPHVIGKIRDLLKDAKYPQFLR